MSNEEIERLIPYFEKAADICEHLLAHGALKQIRSNLLREMAACMGAKFGNTISPNVLRELKRRRPELAWLKVKAPKNKLRKSVLVQVPAVGH